MYAVLQFYLTDSIFIKHTLLYQVLCSSLLNMLFHLTLPVVLWARCYWTHLKIWKLMLTDSYSVQFSSVAQSCPTLCNPMNRSTPGLPVHHQLLEITQTHVHRVSDAIQPSHPLSSPSPPILPSIHPSILPSNNPYMLNSHQIGAQFVNFEIAFWLEIRARSWLPVPQYPWVFVPCLYKKVKELVMSDSLWPHGL